MLPQKSGKARQRRARFARAWLLRAALTVSLPILILGTCARAEEASENQVKAAYLFNFAKSAQWPSALLAEGTAPLIIGVFGGDDEFVDILKGMVAEKTIGSHPIAVKHLNARGDLKRCQMIFFRASERRATRATIASLNSGNLLLVGEDPAFLRDGGMINLILNNGKIQFEIGHDALDRSAIQFSSKFLSLAKANNGSSNQQIDTPRQVRIRIPPEYPSIAKQMNLEGSVQLEATVGRDGSVKGVRVLGGHPLLAEALTRAVMRWKFEPAARDSTELVKYSFGPEQ